MQFPCTLNAVFNRQSAHSRYYHCCIKYHAFIFSGKQLLFSFFFLCSIASCCLYKKQSLRDVIYFRFLRMRSDSNARRPKVLFSYNMLSRRWLCLYSLEFNCCNNGMSIHYCVYVLHSNIDRINSNGSPM